VVMATITDNISYLASLSLTITTITEGKSYVVRVTVTNQSTKAGVPVEATLGIVFVSATAYEIIAPRQEKQESFAPGETKTLDFPMDIPTGLTGREGVIYVEVTDPTDIVIASDTKDLIIEAPPIGDYFVSCEVPAQVALWEEFYASQKVFLTAREGLLFEFELLIGNKVIQLKQIFPVSSDGFYEAGGYAPWGADAIPISLTDIPLGTYNIISRCLVVHCEIVQTPYGPTIRTWGSFELLWEVDTGKTIEVVAGEPPLPPPRGEISAINWNVPASSPSGVVSCSVTYEVTGYIEWGTLYIGYGDWPAMVYGPAPMSEGIHTVPFSFSMPSDGYKYMRCYAAIEYGVSLEWSAMTHKYFEIYLEG